METGIGFSPEGRFKQKLTDKIHNGLKCYEIIDGEITGMAIVPNPANEYKASIVSEEHRRIGGVILTPDKLIYRINPLTGEEYYIYFTTEVIQLLFDKYRLATWFEKDVRQLMDMYAQGHSLQEISLAMNRPVENISNYITEKGEAFRNIIIAIMFHNGYLAEDISERFNLSLAELRVIVEGLKKTLKEDNNDEEV